MSNDIQQFLDNSKKQWAKESNNKGAMSTKQIIKKLKEFKDSNKLIVIDMLDELFTSEFCVDSWRGSYNLPAIEYTSGEKGCYIDTAIKNLSEVSGMDVTGYKGGDYVLDEEDPLFVANYGSSNNCTAIVDIIELDKFIVCLTKQDMY